MSYFPGIHYTLDLLTRTDKFGSGQTTGRQIKSNASDCFNNIKKSYDYAEKKWNTATLKERESGDNLSSVVNHVLRKMFEETHGGVPIHEKYFFKVFSFMLWGPFVPPEKRLMILQPDAVEELPKMKKLTRAKKRKLKLEEDDASRNGDKVNNRGLTNQQVIQNESNKIRILKIKQKMKFQKTLDMKFAYDALRHQYESAKDMAMKLCPAYDKNDENWKEVTRLYNTTNHLANEMLEKSINDNDNTTFRSNTPNSIINKSITCYHSLNMDEEGNDITCDDVQCVDLENEL